MHWILVALSALTLCTKAEAGSLFEYYVGEGISSSLSADEGTTLMLNGKPIQLFSGAFHYYRTHPDYWRDRMRKMKACGLNAVETYVPWNLHEPEEGVFDFGQGNRDMSEFLDLDAFLSMAKEEDLFVIIRPGPYICTEWDFGGLPSYLLKDPNMEVRSTYPAYLNRVDAYFAALLPILNKYQWPREGTEPQPIIVAQVNTARSNKQVENEFGHFGVVDRPYLEHVWNTMRNGGLDNVLYVTSDDTGNAYNGAIFPEVLMTANFYNSPEQNMEALQQLQPGKPLWVMEYWNGWFDHWMTGRHETRPTDVVASRFQTLLSFNSSVNFYMFIGGTNFGFMAGANVVPLPPYYVPDTTSYDYDGLLNEYGNYTEKYEALCALVQDANEMGVNPSLPVPDRPAPLPTKDYGRVEVDAAMTLNTFMTENNLPGYSTDFPVFMEYLSNYLGPNGQDYGFINYRLENVVLEAGYHTIEIEGRIKDVLYLLVNGVQVNSRAESVFDLLKPGFWVVENPTFNVSFPGGPVTIDLLVENLGRVNFGVPTDFSSQRKGIDGTVSIDGQAWGGWETTPLRFDRTLMSQGQSILEWNPDISICTSSISPCLYHATLTIEGEPVDTFLEPYPDGIDESAWMEGMAFVNGFNLGRYWRVGPTRRLYVPAPFLRQGDNDIILFETGVGGSEIAFKAEHCLQLNQC